MRSNEKAVAVAKDVLKHLKGYVLYNMPITEKNEEIFGVENAREIEVAFEQGTGWYGYSDVVNFEDAQYFGKYFKQDKARLAAIMQNIVDHDGHFIPGIGGKNAKKYKRTY